MLLVKDWLPKAVADGDDLDARAHMLVACACKRPSASLRLHARMTYARPKDSMVGLLSGSARGRYFS